MAAITQPSFTFELPGRRPELVAARRPLVLRHPAAVYRRRRLAVAALLLGALLATGWASGALGGDPLTAAGTRSTTAVELHVAPVSQATYVVAPGDTLWSIARQLVPEGDVRPVVDSLAAHRNGRPLQVGERIVLP